MSVQRDRTDSLNTTGVNPARRLPELEFVLSTIEANPFRSTVASQEIADLLGLRQDQATTILQYADEKGLVDRWSAQNHQRNPKWRITRGDLDADR